MVPVWQEALTREEEDGGDTKKQLESAAAALASSAESLSIVTVKPEPFLSDLKQDANYRKMEKLI